MTALEIYPADFATRYELTHAISVQMSIYYNDIGKIIVYAPVNNYNINALKVRNIIYDVSRQETYIIANTKIDTEANQIIVNGYTANWILNKRSIAVKRTVTTLESGIYDLINENMRNLPRVSTASPTGLTEATNNIFYGGQILDEILPFLDEAGLGQKMIWDPDSLSWTFQIYKGRDLTSGIHAVVFSEEMGTAKELVINDDDSIFKNIAYVKGSLKNDTEFVEVVGDVASADDRREIWLDTSVFQESDESESDCRARAIAYAQMELGQRIHRQSFAVSIDSSELGSIYNLGDIVSCVSVRFGVSFNARITGIKYEMDSNKIKTEIILGDPILTALGVYKINGKY
ncbi:Gp37-like protein [Treponema sp.]|uniref:Gp37-like protein n=1 Tax=Treponema sp. TaxID=166 RepID=UPI00388DBDD6